MSFRTYVPLCSPLHHHLLVNPPGGCLTTLPGIDTPLAGLNRAKSFALFLHFPDQVLHQTRPLMHAHKYGKGLTGCGILCDRRLNHV